MDLVTPFTPLPAALGGALIGTAAVLLLGLNGRVAGVSGIYGGLLPGRAGDIAWRLAFLAGLPAGAALANGWLGGAPTPLPTSPALLVASGALVGYGTTLARGCTSGHGVCGLARLSGRSLAAVATFLATGVLTVTLMRHALGAAP
ncbi:YeeE/YedE family protein [Pelomonas sp. P7]|uniref:YeeE/YedE family protein n=1 Tax=Pelomonas caseinilytica TaxID=2906763 RepID=A0ABS8XJE7_9BURK|nr:YeeE/YedE thiosulfate transporter family protein [Pelomonas sp. P7]MCE4539677.1 YeeE/YedE family protein [Pelomonas sp. P7]